MSERDPQNEPPRDEERIANIERTIKEMGGIGDFNPAEIVAREMEDWCETLSPIYRLFSTVMDESHADEPLREQWKMWRSIKLASDAERHVKQCDTCKPLFLSVLRRLNRNFNF